MALRQFFQKRPEPGEEVIHADESLFAEIPELEQQRSKFLTQIIHDFDELFELRITINQHFFVRDDLWNLRGIKESGRRLRVPSYDRTLYSSFDQPAAKLARNFYFAIRDLEADHNTACTLESKNQKTATFYSKTGILHCGNRTISESVSKFQDQNEEGQLTESVK